MFLSRPSIALVALYATLSYAQSVLPIVETQKASALPGGGKISEQIASNPNPQVPPGAIYCPKVSELIKRDLYWYGPNTWKDYSPSFVNSIRSFAGAQWLGVNVGKMICLYNGLERDNFPISIERDNLIKRPSGFSWVKDTRTGYTTCQSNSIVDCPFFPETQKKEENLYESIKALKKD